MYECCLSNEVVVEISCDEHNVVNSDLESGVLDKKERVYGINPYFKEIISKFLKESPNMQPMEIMK